MTSDILKRAAEAVEGVTPGPWSWCEIDPSDPDWSACEVESESDYVSTFVCGTDNARFIAAARTLIPDMAAAIAERDAENARLTARAEAAEAMVDRDADLLLDAYKALLVLHRMLDKHGLTAGVEAANSLANRIVAAHPEMPGRAAMKEGQ